VRFPILRDKRLISADFFREDVEGFSTELDKGKYDFVIGNAPWGRNTVTELAKSWAKDRWEITYGNIGPLFLPKAASLTKIDGRVAMMQPAGVLIFNQINTAKNFREKLFSEHKVEEIVNLSALRFGLFKDAISPSCIITISSISPDGKPFDYICPKSVCSNEDDYRIVIEPQDMNAIYPQEAIRDSVIFTALMWGGRRDLILIRRLSREQNLNKLENDGIVVKRQGVIRGDRQKLQPSILGRRILKSKTFPQGTFLFLKVQDLPINEDQETDSRASTDFSAFDLPQLIIKQSWQTKSRRFQAAITELKSSANQGIICSNSYVSVHVSQEELVSILETACLCYNSKFAVYYLFLTNGSFAFYIPKVGVEDLLHLPIPEPRKRLLLNTKTIEDVDRHINEAFAFKESEWVLIEDLFNYTLPDFKGDSNSPGRKTTRSGQKTGSQDENSEPILRQYCEYFLRVMKAGFGQDKNICATIFQERTETILPIRLVAIYLNSSHKEGVKIESIDSPELLEELSKLNRLFSPQENTENVSIFYQRVAKIYDSVQLNGETIPTIYFVKPDKIRYWTRSMALRDADEVAAELMMGATEFSNNGN
ncbi:MAG: SAM-dependent DNA methyltransferase, partial [Okeania sp. SIO3B3]|nr:SAM-dependent DNA methyltransferase [Okeania sp. SIO3B3]